MQVYLGLYLTLQVCESICDWFSLFSQHFFWKLAFYNEGVQVFVKTREVTVQLICFSRYCGTCSFVSVVIFICMEKKLSVLATSETGEYLHHAKPVKAFLSQQFKPFPFSLPWQYSCSQFCKDSLFHESLKCYKLKVTWFILTVSVLVAHSCFFTNYVLQIHIRFCIL